MSAEISLVKEKTASLKSIETLQDLDLRIDDFKCLESLDEVQDFEEQLKFEDEFAKAVCVLFYLLIKHNCFILLELSQFLFKCGKQFNWYFLRNFLLQCIHSEKCF